MKKRLFSILMALVMVLSLLPATALAADDGLSYDENGFSTGGDSVTYQPATQVTADNCENLGLTESYVGYYAIGNAGQLYWFAGLVNGTLTDGTTQNTTANAVLTADITVNSGVLDEDGALASNPSSFKVWTPIGSAEMNDDNDPTDTTTPNAYAGTFDGQDHIISGLYLNDSNKGQCGLFGVIKSGASVSKVTVSGSYISGRNNVGGVCGYNYKGTITNCTNSGDVTGTVKFTGGVCGYNAGNISGCSNSGTVNGTRNTGGVCGFNASTGEIQNCLNQGAVTGSEFYTGGVCGYNNSVGNKEGTITNCTNSGTVKGTDYTGGVCGSNKGKIQNCANHGTVTGNNYTGGVCGYNNAGTITNCANVGAVSGNSDVGGVCGKIYGGSITNCYFNSDAYLGIAVGSNGVGTATAVEGKTADQFASGEVAWLLRGGATDNGSTWGQTIGTDPYPVLGGETVYQTSPCPTYTNSETETQKEHDYVHGLCANCGAADGTISDPYVIDSQNALNAFVKAVNNGNVSINATLTVDGLTLTTPIGQNAEGLRYTGTFDGQNHTLTVDLKGVESTAPFAAIDGATVKNLTVTGSITCTVGISGVGGAVGFSYGSSQITGVISHVAITDTGVVLHHVGGVVGSARTGTTVEKCMYDGTINLTATTDCIGGIVGYANENTSIQNSANLGSVHSSASDAYVGGILGYVNNANFAGLRYCYNFGSVTCSSGTYCGAIVGRVNSNTEPSTITNNYYLTTSCANAFGTGGQSGTATSATAEEFASGEVAWLLNGSTSEGAWGQTIDKDPYPVLDGATVYQTSPCGAAYSNTSGTKEHRYVTGICANCGAVQEGITNYVISDQDHLNAFVKAVNSGNVSINARLTTDGLTLTTPIGQNADGKRYTGTFDGQNHTLTVDLKGGESTAPFAAIENTTIKNLRTTGTIQTGGKYAAGLVSNAWRTVTIENCYSDVVITSTVNGDGTHGGLVGRSNHDSDDTDGNPANITIRNCGFAGQINGADTNACGGLMGWIHQGQTIKIENCYVAGTFTVSGTGSDTICRNIEKVTAAVTNFYYLTKLGGFGGGDTGLQANCRQLTAAQFASGEAAWLLRGGEEDNNSTWGQTIGTDAYPVPGGATVYRLNALRCDGQVLDTYVFSNSTAAPIPDHTFSGNTCTVCGYSMPIIPVIPTYPPTVTQPAEGGSVTVSPVSPAAGATVTITAKPEDGYEVGSVTVTDRNGAPVEVTDNGDGTYSFTQPAGAVKVEVQFKETACDGGADCSSHGFTDVNTNLWYHEAIDYVVENGIMNGVGGGKFDPTGNLSRSMLMTMLARLDGVDTDGGANWYEKGLNWAVANGVSDGTNPDGDISRQEVAAMLYRYAQLKGYDTSARADLSAFTDGDQTASWAEEAMEWAVQSGVLQGDNNRALNPEGSATRAEVAQMLMNFLSNLNP